MAKCQACKLLPKIQKAKQCLLTEAQVPGAINGSHAANHLFPVVIISL